MLEMLKRSTINGGATSACILEMDLAQGAAAGALMPLPMKFVSSRGFMTRNYLG